MTEEFYAYSLYLHNQKVVRIFLACTKSELDAFNAFLNSCEDVVTYDFYIHE